MDINKQIESEKFLTVSDFIEQIINLQGDTDEDSLVEEIILITENLQDIADFHKIIGLIISNKLHSALILKMFNSRIFTEKSRYEIINSFLKGSIRQKLFYITYEVLITFWEEIVI